MVNSPPRVVLDTNVLISALLFGGKPKQLLDYAYSYRCIAITSRVLLAELHDILIKKFDFSNRYADLYVKKLEQQFISVSPKKTIQILKDKPDNRVLEAAIEGECEYIVTGDKELLDRKKWKYIHILTVNEFVDVIN